MRKQEGEGSFGRLKTIAIENMKQYVRIFIAGWTETAIKMKYACLELRTVSTVNMCF